MLASWLPMDVEDDELDLGVRLKLLNSLDACVCSPHGDQHAKLACKQLRSKNRGIVGGLVVINDQDSQGVHAVAPPASVQGPDIVPQGGAHVE